MGENIKLIHMIVLQLLVMIFLISYIVINWQIQKINVDNIETNGDANKEEMKKSKNDRANKLGPFAWESYLKPNDFPTHFTTFIFACVQNTRMLYFLLPPVRGFIHGF